MMCGGAGGQGVVEPIPCRYQGTDYTGLEKIVRLPFLINLFLFKE